MSEEEDFADLEEPEVENENKIIVTIDPIGSLNGHNGLVSAVDVGKDCNNNHILVSGSSDYDIVVWKLNILDGEFIAGEDKMLGEPYRILEGHTGPISGLSLIDNCKLLISSSWDGTLMIWNLKNFKVKKVIKAHSSKIIALLFDCRTELIYSASKDYTTKVWNLNGDLKKIISEQNGYGTCIKTINLNDRFMIVIGTSKGEIIIYDENLEIVEKLEDIGMETTGLASDNCSEFLFVGLKSGLVRIFDLRDQHPVLGLTLELDCKVNTVLYEDSLFPMVAIATSKGLYLNRAIESDSIFKKEGCACYSLAYDAKSYLFAGMSDGKINVIKITIRKFDNI